MKFGKSYPLAKAWWKNYKLSRKVDKLKARVVVLEEEILALQDRCDKLEREKRGIFSSAMMEVGQHTMAAERLREEVKQLKKKLYPPEETTLQEGSKLRRLVGRLRGKNGRTNEEAETRRPESSRAHQLNVRKQEGHSRGQVHSDHGDCRGEEAPTKPGNTRP